MFSLFGRSKSLRKYHPRSLHQIHRRPLTVEPLEDRCLPSVVINEYQVPVPAGHPNDWDSLYTITAGPDGNLWFTEHNTARIGRITPAGTITEFPPLNPGSQPNGITAGPDGNLWFTEEAATPPGPTNPGPGVSNKIGRITPSGILTEFQVPTVYSGPFGITAGPDGNLWFTESVSNKIGRITPTGSITEFSIPTSNSSPEDIAAGPDGNLWFVERLGNAIGRITPTGVISTSRSPHSMLSLRG